MIITRARLALAMLALSGLPALAQATGTSPGRYGTEDGYGGDGIGWGPAYRPETNFRPQSGFYGGVERPNPYATGPDTTGNLPGRRSPQPGGYGQR